MSDDCNLTRELAPLRVEIQSMHLMLNEMHRALLGDLQGNTGLIGRIGAAENRLERGDGMAAAWLALMKKLDERLEAIETWQATITNRAIGVGIGLALGSAGIGATVAAIVSRLIGLN
jgi:hypothetical protein